MLDRGERVAGGYAGGGASPGHNGAIARPGRPRERVPLASRHAAVWPWPRSAGPSPAAPALGRRLCALLNAARARDGPPSTAPGHYGSVAERGPQSSESVLARNDARPCGSVPGQGRVRAAARSSRHGAPPATEASFHHRAWMGASAGADVGGPLPPTIGDTHGRPEGSRLGHAPWAERVYADERRGHGPLFVRRSRRWESAGEAVRAV